MISIVVIATVRSEFFTMKCLILQLLRRILTFFFSSHWIPIASVLFLIFPFIGKIVANFQSWVECWSGSWSRSRSRKKHIALVIVLWMMRKRTQVDEFRYLCHSKKWRRKNSIKITFNLYLAFRFAGNVGRCRCRRNSRKYIFHAHHCLDSRRTHINCVSVCVFCMFSIAFPKSWICKQKIFLSTSTHTTVYKCKGKNSVLYANTFNIVTKAGEKYSLNMTL